MSKDNRHENILQKQGGAGEEECSEKDKHDDEEEAVPTRKDEDDDEVAASRKDEDDDEVVAPRKDEDDKEVAECETPNSIDSKIPLVTGCPGAPRKKTNMRLSSHKRKLSELQFFEATRSEEVDSLFRSNSDSFSTNNNTGGGGGGAAAAAEPLRFKKRRSRNA